MNRESQHSQLIKLQKALFRQNIPFVSYRLPLETEIITLVQHQSLPEKLVSLNELDNKTGFVIAPFTASGEHNSYFLKPDCVFFSYDIADIYIQKLADNNRFIELAKTENTLLTTTADEYIGNVNKAVEAMKANDFHKVVLSKVRLEQLPDNFQPEIFFLKLCSNYPHAMVYFLQLPGVGCWIGATPEPLLVIEDETVKTVSLAGTQISDDKPLESYQWAEKELEEQGIVTGFVEKTLQSLGISNYSKTGPENYQAANLIHLKRNFTAGWVTFCKHFTPLLQ